MHIFDVAVIDFGIDDELLNYTHAFEYKEKKLVRQNIKCASLEEQHGTHVCKILENLNIKKIAGINIKQDELTEERLYEILHYILQNKLARYINISFGFIKMENTFKFEELLYEMLKENIIVFAAFNNDGGMSFPACLENAIGVDMDYEVYSFNKYKYIENSVVNVLMSYRNQYIIYNDIKIKIVGTSFLIPRLIGIVSKNDECINNFSELKDFLKRKSFLQINKRNNNIKENNIYKVFQNKNLKVAVLGITKETRNIIRFSNLNISVVFDFLHNNNENTSQLEFDKSIPIVDFNKFENYDFDIVVIPHLQEYKVFYGERLKKFLSFLCKEEKFIYSFDKIEFLNKNYLNYYCPNKKCQTINFGKLYYLNKPVIAILGTSSIVGKFNIQMKLKEYFLKNQYKVGHFMTEPGEFLYEEKYSLPMGFGSNHKIGYENIEYINNCLYEYTKTEDILIIGTQSFVLHNNFNNIRNFNFEVSEIINASNPDILILAVNINDPIEYILKTIQYLNIYNEGIISGIIIFGYKRNLNEKNFNKFIKINAEESISFKKIINEHTLIPIYRDDEIDILYEDIIKKLGG